MDTKELKECITILDQYTDEELFNKKCVEAHRIAIEACEKAFLKSKVTDFTQKGEHIAWLCPKCGRFHRTDRKKDYCSACGQVLKW